jgi:zinc protease
MVGRVVACLVVMAACALPKPPPPAPARQTVLGLSVKSMVLGNGLRVVLVQDPHANEVQVTMRYRIGAGDDLENPGMAHLVEHLMFQQTLGAQTLFAHLEDNATFFNAYTTYDATTYVSRARPELLDKLLSIEAVRLGFRCTSITDSAFEREREVVKQEVRLSNDSTQLQTALHAAVYAEGHPYRQAIEGTVQSVGAITRQQACAFADSYYASSNAVLVISGHVSVDQVKSSLGKFLARIAKRTAASPSPVSQPTKWSRAASAPLDKQALLVTWRMPLDPYAQIGVRTIAELAEGLIDTQIKGTVEYLELGDVRAPVFGFAVIPGKDETVEDVLKKVQDTIEMLPTVLDSWMLSPQVFDALRQGAIYKQYASLEDGPNRDERLATYVLAGRDPASALAEEFRALRNLSQKEAVKVATDHFAFADASLVRIMPSSTKKRGHAIDVKAAIHDMGQRRSVPDPGLAQQPDASMSVPSLAPVTRTLPNGLKVVILPMSTVPTVDIRLVFGAGSADEPADKYGTATLTAEALSFDMRHANDVWNFAIAGGSLGTNVQADSTSFIVRGVDMHIDYLLAGLRRRAIDGRYSDWADKLVDAIRDQDKKKREQDDCACEEENALADAWAGAVYGSQHPYGRPGFMRRLSRALSVDDAERFRAAYYTPDNATLIVAGHVDVELTNRWIDFLFADWQGKAQQRATSAAKLAAASIAKPEDLSQMQIRIALPSQGTRAQLLVLASMLREISDDVRHQLGAAYGFHAELDESRLATHLVIGGWIDPARANDVVQLLRDRIAKLRDDAAIAAGAFVTARRRVMVSLVSLVGSASLLASRIESDVQMGRAPLSDLDTAKQVKTLTIGDMKPLLAELDLARGAMLMRGPAEPLNAAFVALGRQPTLVKVDQAALDALDGPLPEKSRKSHKQSILDHDIEDAITDRSFAAQGPIEVAVYAGVTFGTVSYLVPPGQAMAVEGGPWGPIVAAEVGYRFRKRASAGLQFSIGNLSGSYADKVNGIEIGRISYGLVPIDLGGYLHLRARGPLWGGFTTGVHFDGARFDGERSWTRGIGFGVELGYDAFHLGSHALAIYFRATGALASDIGFGSLGGGIAYHR